MLDLEIRTRIAGVIEKEIEPEDLAGWLETEMWNADDERPPTQQLGHDALRLLAEHDHDDWTDSELREKLGVLSRTYWFWQAAEGAPVGSASGGVTRQSQPLPWVGRWHAAVPA